MLLLMERQEVHLVQLDVYKRQGKITGNIIKEIYVPGKIVNIVAK